MQRRPRIRRGRFSTMSRRSRRGSSGRSSGEREECIFSEFVDGCWKGRRESSPVGGSRGPWSGVPRVVLPRPALRRTRTRILPPRIPRIPLVSIPLPPVSPVPIPLTSPAFPLPLPLASALPFASSLRIPPRTLSVGIPRIVLPSTGAALPSSAVPLPLAAIPAPLSFVSGRIIVVFSPTAFRHWRGRSCHPRNAVEFAEVSKVREVGGEQKSELRFFRLRS